MAFISGKWNGEEFFSITNFHHLKFYVGNAKQACYYYKKVFGFHLYAYSGPETGNYDSVQYVMKNNQIFFVLVTPLKSSHPGSDWLKKHGDGVFDIAFDVESPKEAHDICIANGGNSYEQATSVENELGIFHKAGIMAYGDVKHSLINSKEYSGAWAPGFKRVDLNDNKNLKGKLIKIDHIVANVEDGKMDEWKNFYEKVFGFTAFVKFDENDISTKFSALRSVVVRNKNWKIKLPINEPAQGLKKSQIEEFLVSNEGPGVQHIALLTDDIISSIENFRKSGAEFLEVPNSYYDELSDRVGFIDEEIKLLKKNKILVDRDEEGYLLQLFTKPIEDRPTLFIEIIQRKGSRGFGQGNFQALFEAIEREQSLRGNL